MNQLLGQQHPPGLGHRRGRGAQVLAKQPPQLALADAQSIGQGLHVGPVEGPRFRIKAKARETVLEVPRQAARSGAVSGRQRRHGRNPAAWAPAAEAKKSTFSALGVRAGQIGRQ